MHLFNQEDLNAELRARRERAACAVDEIQKEQFLLSEDHEIVDHIVSEFSVEPLVLHEAGKTMDQSETRVDVSKDPNRFPPLNPTGPFYVTGTRVDVKIPFSGDEWLFQYQTNPRPMEPLHAEFDQQCVLLSISFADDIEPENFRRAHGRKLDLLRRFADYSGEPSTELQSGSSRVCTNRGCEASGAASQASAYCRAAGHSPRFETGCAAASAGQDRDSPATEITGAA